MALRVLFSLNGVPNVARRTPKNPRAAQSGGNVDVTNGDSNQLGISNQGAPRKVNSFQYP